MTYYKICFKVTNLPMPLQTTVTFSAIELSSKKKVLNTRPYVYDIVNRSSWIVAHGSQKVYLCLLLP